MPIELKLMIFIVIFFLSVCLAFWYFEGMPGEYIYKRKIVYIMPWKRYLKLMTPAICILFVILMLFLFVNNISTPLNEILYSMIVEAIIFISIIAIVIVLARKTFMKVRISRGKLIILYRDAKKRTRMRLYCNLKIYIKDIENIERVYFPDFFLDFDVKLINRKLDGIYTYVITCSSEKAVDGIDITLSNGKHIVFETDDVENCMEVLKRVSYLSKSVR